MRLVLNRLVPFIALLSFGLLPVRGASAAPVFLTGTSGPYPNYDQEVFSTVPVGKTLVLPIAIQGTGPMAYTVTSTNPGILPIVKTGYPVMTIKVSYSGTSGSLTTLYSFTGGKDQGGPYAGVIQASDGNLYGATEPSAAGDHGTVFRLTTSGSLATLHSFTGGADGGEPFAPLVQGTGGDLYGATETDGTGGYGTVFQITTSGSLTTLHSFTGGADGGNPYAGLVQGNSGDFYGATSAGGSGGHGTLFQLTSSGTLTTIYSFTGGSDGGDPRAGLVVGGAGDFYGTAVSGGASSMGTVFHLAASGSLTTLHSFTGGKDGGSPYGALIEGTGGDLYGTTETGGGGSSGTIFKLTTSGSLTTLHAFARATNGANPYAGLVQAGDGNFYGVTETGGTSGFGTVFELTSSGSFATLHSFAGGNDGGNPYGRLVEGSNGLLYGTAKNDGGAGNGSVFRIPLPNEGAFGGTMTFALLRDMAPVTAGYISGLAQAGYYNGLDFFRITNLAGTYETPAFIAQGGDPTETGTGGPGFTFNNEFSPSLIFNGEGQLAMANSGNNQETFQGTNSSQFFITQGPIRSLDFGYTIFGQLLTGFDVMQNVMSVPLQSNGSSPVQPVVMDSVTVTEDDNDAILLVNAAGAVPGGATLHVNATDPAGQKAVVLTGTVSSPGLPIFMSTYDDTVNDPPIVLPDPDVTTGLHQSVSFPLRAEDLEFDYLITNAQLLSFSSAGVSLNNGVVTVSPGSAPLVGSATVGMDVYQPFVSVERSNAYDETPVTVGLGSGKLTSLPALFSGTSDGSLASSAAGFTGSSSAFASFLTSNPGASPAGFTPLINWGDGTLTTGSDGASVVRSPSGLPTQYEVSCPSGHAYAAPGIYPLNVTVTDTNGGILQVLNTAVISSGPIYAFGRAFTAPAGLADGLVATFIDHTPHMIAADYGATINWGDGAVRAGTIRGASGNFTVYGAHQYAGGTTYPVDVTVNSLIDKNSAHAWSIVKLSGAATHQPPFPQSHVTGEIGNPGFDGDYLDEEVTLVNSGNLPSGPIALQFYLSPTSETQPISSAAIPLSVAKRATYNTPSIPAGGAIQGSVSEITVPSNVTTFNKFIIMQVITSDPVANHMDYPHAFADPFPLVE
jgi:uncharacterized repeat protein (TIGR03803 family)